MNNPQRKIASLKADNIASVDDCWMEQRISKEIEEKTYKLHT
jgi:hypothetical protein